MFEPKGDDFDESKYLIYGWDWDACLAHLMPSETTYEHEQHSMSTLYTLPKHKHIGNETRNINEPTAKCTQRKRHQPSVPFALSVLHLFIGVRVCARSVA